MADLTEFVFDTDSGSKILVLDKVAISELNSALSMMQTAPDVRKDIIHGRKKVPPLLYDRFHKMMQKRLGRSPVRIGLVKLAAPPPSTPESAGGRGKAIHGRAKALPIGEQIELKRARKQADQNEGRIYRDFLPVTVGATINRAKGEPTSNIFAVGKHRGTIYIVEEISAPVSLPATHMPQTVSGRRRAQEAALAKYQWQARVLSHPWTRLSRGGFAERSKSGASTSGLAGLHRVGELTTHTFPAESGKNGWEKAQNDVERAIDRSYEYRVEIGHIPPELERHVKKEIEEIQKGGRTPSLSPRVRQGTSGMVRQRRGGRAIPVVRKPGEENPGKIRSRKRSSMNPTSEVHQEIGEGFLAESEKLWESYCKTRLSTTLLDAYRVLELARQEFEYTGDKKRLQQANDGIRAARSEIIGSHKKSAKRKASKKSSKKKAPK